MSGWIAVLSLIVSGVAIVIAALAHVREHRLSKRMVALEESREQDRIQQKRRANVVARLERDSTTKVLHLVFENTGAAEARGIQILMEGKPILKHPAMARNPKEIRQVGSNSSFRYLMMAKPSLMPPYTLDITWSDDSGQQGSYRTTVTL